MSRLSKILVVMSLALSLGLQWPILQSMAWVSMMVQYSQHNPWLTALEMTFDGQHPCAICHFVAQGKKSEQEQQRENPLQVVKYDLFLESPAAIWLLKGDPAVFHSPDERGCVRFEEPPSPPPRVA